MSQGASIDSLLSGLCLTCSTTNLNNVIDADPQTYGSVFLPVALLNAAVTVTATAEPPYAPFTAGPTAGFVVATANGSLLTAEVGNQIVVRTLNGDRKSIVKGQSVSVRVALGGRRTINTNNNVSYTKTHLRSQTHHSNTLTT